MCVVFYLLCIGFTGYVMVMYDASWCMELMVFEVLVLLAGFLTAWRLKYAVKISFSMKNNVVQKNDKIPVSLNIKNTSFFPVQKLTIGVDLQRAGSAACEQYQVNSAVDSKGETYIELFFESGYCGIVNIKINQIIVWDYLKFFKRKRRISQETSVIVIPRIYPAALSVVSSFRYFTGEGDVYSDTESGDDPSEVFEIRDYRPGDKMQKIHWKLSARMDEMFVKEYSEPVGFAIVIVLDFSGTAMGEADEDLMMSAAFSMSNGLLTEGYTHYIAWMTSEGVWSRFKIITDESIYTAMPYMMKVLTKIQYDGSKNDMTDTTAQAYDERYGRASYHTMLRIDGGLRVYQNEMLAASLDKNDLEKALLDMNLEI